MGRVLLLSFKGESVKNAADISDEVEQKAHSHRKASICISDDDSSDESVSVARNKLYKTPDTKKNNNKI